MRKERGREGHERRRSNEAKRDVSRRKTGVKTGRAAADLIKGGGGGAVCLKNKQVESRRDFGLGKYLAWCVCQHFFQGSWHWELKGCYMLGFL